MTLFLDYLLIQFLIGLLINAVILVSGNIPKSITVIFKWYDLWIGVFIDTKIYHFPFPMIGIVYEFTS